MLIVKPRQPVQIFTIQRKDVPGKFLKCYRLSAPETLLVRGFLSRQEANDAIDDAGMRYCAQAVSLTIDPSTPAERFAFGNTVVEIRPESVVVS